MESLKQDLRYAFRSFLTHRTSTALAVLCLALGIGVNSTVYSVVDSISIRPLPFADPDNLVTLVSTRPASGINRSTVSYPDFIDWRTSTRVIADVAAQSGRNIVLSDDNNPERFVGALVSWNLFPLLGVDPILGRPFGADDDRAGAAGTIILSHGVWERRYLSDPGIIGRSIPVNGRAHTVIAVMPPRFRFPEFAQVWVPLTPAYTEPSREIRNLVVYGRLRDGATLAEARAEIATVADGLRTYRENDGWSASAITMRDEMMPDDIVLVTTTMLGAVILVLLVACANVANLLLVRATERQREIAVRTALGAGRGRIIRQMLTESLLTALISAPLGIAVAYGGLWWLTASIPSDDLVPYYIDWSMNWRIVIYTGAVAVVTGMLFGLVPALHAADGDLHRSLKDGARGTSTGIRRNRLRHGLVVAEIAMSLVLLTGASLFIRSALNLHGADVGFDTTRLMTMRVFLTGDSYASPDARQRRVEDVVQRIEALPGVEAAFASNYVPLNGGGGWSNIVLDGVPVEPGREQGAGYLAVTPHAIDTLGIRLLAGRDFTDAEGLSRSRIALVNPDLARRLAPSPAGAIGRRFRMAELDADAWFTVVGVVENFHAYGVDEDDPWPFALVSYPYMPSENAGFTIRVSGSPAAITPSVREEIRRADAGLPLFGVRTGEENRLLSFWGDQIISWMFSIFGVVALLLAAIGIYGVLSHSVAQRTQELGVRVALGASRQDVLKLILGHGARLAAIGVVLGIVGAAAVTRVVESVLYNVSATDPVSFAGTALFLIAVALAAVYVPARRATVVDPIVALRVE